MGTLHYDLDLVKTCGGDMMKLDEVIDKSSQWLIAQQCKETGGWGERPGKAANSLNTAEAIIAIMDARAVEAGSKLIQNGIKFLKGNQCSEQDKAGSWTRWSRIGENIFHQTPDIVRTTFAIQALIKGGVGSDDESLENGINWLLSARSDTDGGWGCRKGAISAVLPTCFALMALTAAYKAEIKDFEEPINEGLKFLVENNHKSEGYFGDSGPLEGVQTIYAVLALQAARNCELNSYIKKEKVAIRWLLENPDKARKMVEWFVEIDPHHADANYTYLFMTESLLVRVLSESLSREHRKSELARDTMSDLKDKMDPSGGFYGYRIFSWATAKVLCSMSRAKNEYVEFPTRRPEYSGTKVGHILMFFILVLLGAVIYLTRNDMFNSLQAGVFVILMLASLLAYGRIRETTFKELLQKIISLFGKG